MALNQDKFPRRQEKTEFSERVRRAIAKYPKVTKENRDQMQKEQMERIAAVETLLRQCIIQSQRGPEVYTRFIEYITHTRGNIMAGQPYFREAVEDYTNKFGPAIRAVRPRTLFEAHPNHSFFTWVEQGGWMADVPEYRKHMLELREARNAIVVTMMPFVIDRTRKFYRKTTRSIHTYEDYLSMGIDGLLVAVDKWRMPYRVVFRSSVISQVDARFITAYSQTMMRFGSSEKRKLYHANKLSRQFSISEDIGALVAAVNNSLANPALPKAPTKMRLLGDPQYVERMMARLRGLTEGVSVGEVKGARVAAARQLMQGKPKKKVDSVTESEIIGIVHAANMFTLNYKSASAEEDRDMELGDEVQADDDSRPDRIYEQKEEIQQLSPALASLSVMERKVLRITMGVSC